MMNVVGKTLKILWTHCEYLSILENLLAFPTNELQEPLNLVCGHNLASEENLWTFVVNFYHFVDTVSTFSEHLSTLHVSFF